MTDPIDQMGRKVERIRLAARVRSRTAPIPPATRHLRAFRDAWEGRMKATRTEGPRA